MAKIEPVDLKYKPEKPDVNFSASKNQSIIEGTIKKYEEMRIKAQEAHYRQVGERSEAVVQWLDYRGRGGQKDIEQYIGKEKMEYLRGQKDEVLRGNLILPTP